MVNNINGLTTVQNSTSRSREKPQAATDTPSKASESSRAGSSDKVELSTGAKQLQELEAGLKDFPEVNQERVSHLRDALREGSYSVDPARLAAKIVQFELDI